MRKYAIAALLFLPGKEILSWIALTIIVGMALYGFFKEVINQL